MNAKQIAAIVMGLAAFGLTIWAIVLLIIMIAHAVSTFVTAIVLLVIASILGWGAMALMGSIAWEKVGKLFS